MLTFDDPETWPTAILKQLGSASVKTLLTENRSMNEQVLNSSDIRAVMTDIEDHANNVGVAVFHCTKQLEERPLKRTGLRVLDFKTHHDEFRNLIRQHPEVDTKLYEYIDEALSRRKKQLDGVRAGRLCFCLFRQSAIQDANGLVEYFGGESIYFLFDNDDPPIVKNILRRLGEPVVVEARVLRRDVHAYFDDVIGYSLVSYYARTINADFAHDVPECWLECDIPPENIVEVHPWGTFCTRFST